MTDTVNQPEEKKELPLTQTDRIEQLPETPEINPTPETENETESLRQLKEAVEKAEISAPQSGNIQSDAQQIARQNDDQKIRDLVELAKIKGVVHAVKVAQKLSDPYIVDRLHDELISQGMYKLPR